jgi:hypothetical protein
LVVGNGFCPTFGKQQCTDDVPHVVEKTGIEVVKLYPLNARGRGFL